MGARVASGERHGRLEAVRFVRPSKGGPVWLYACNCGNTCEVLAKAVRAGNTRSCGCLSREVVKVARRTHGHSANGRLSSEYICWRSMRERCSNPNNKSFGRYGGIGIRVCIEWENNFLDFLSYIGPKPSIHHSIDRIDPLQGYQPGNVRWATAVDQNRNKRNTRYVIYQGRRMSLAEASEMSGLSYDMVKQRLNAGWSERRAFEVAA